MLRSLRLRSYSLYGDAIFKATGAIKSANAPDKRNTAVFRATHPELCERWREQDRVMAHCRASIEHVFCGVKNQWSFLQHREKLQLLQPNKNVQKFLANVFFLNDMKACIYGNQTSERFMLPPPQLDEYLTELRAFNAINN